MRVVPVAIAFAAIASATTLAWVFLAQPGERPSDGSLDGGASRHATAVDPGGRSRRPVSPAAVGTAKQGGDSQPVPRSPGRSTPPEPAPAAPAAPSPTRSDDSTQAAPSALAAAAVTALNLSERRQPWMDEAWETTVLRGEIAATIEKFRKSVRADAPAEVERALAAAAATVLLDYEIETQEILARQVELIKQGGNALQAALDENNEKHLARCRTAMGRFADQHLSDLTREQRDYFELIVFRKG